MGIPNKEVVSHVRLKLEMPTEVQSPKMTTIQKMSQRLPARHIRHQTAEGGT